jgi:MFS transporter, Spinster family, sphingosine-1-phosphate transporter
MNEFSTSREAGAVPAPGPEIRPRPGAWPALALLLAINLFNYIDRQVLAAVEPEIREEILPDVSGDEARFKMGLLYTGFLITYMVIAPLFGALAERVSRWWLVGIGVILWSMACAASGLDWHVDLATAFVLLLITRCLVGVGEGAYGPVAPAMISDLYPVQKRGQVLSVFYLAIPVGGALGYALGEIVKELYGWRWAFYVVLPPGLLLGLWCFFMREPGRRAGDVSVSQRSKPALQVWWKLLKIPSFLYNTIGMTAMTFAIGGLAYWMPDYLKERNAPGLGDLGPRTLFGGITALAGLVATITGGLAGDWLRPRFPGSYFMVSGFALILGFPMVLGFLWTPFPWAWVFVFLAVFCLFFNTGPTNTILANVTRPEVRAAGFALNIFLIHLLGDAISPPIIGFISGRTNTAIGFVVVSLMCLVGGLVWLRGARYLKADTLAAQNF